MDTIKEFRSDVPVVYEADVCVLGGSCTGVFAAVRAARVMVNMNQTGEAAGVASALAVSNSCPVYSVDPQCLREKMQQGGSIIL